LSARAISRDRPIAHVPLKEKSMHNIYLVSLWTALALLLAVANAFFLTVVNLGKSAACFEDLVLAGCVLLYG
jgi:hypothetical protein